MRLKPAQSIIVAALLALGLALPVMGCMGAETEGFATTQNSATTLQTDEQHLSTDAGDSFVGLDPEALSTFESKDPFIQQAAPPETTAPLTPTPPTAASGTNTTESYATNTTFYLTTTTVHGGSNTTAHGTTTTRLSTTTTTAPHAHALKVLSIATVGGAPAVTLQVDNSVYKDKRVGDAMSTSWGQVKLLDLSTASKVATLLHGSETLVLTVGQQVYE